MTRRPYRPGAPTPYTYDPVTKKLSFEIIGVGPCHDHTKAVRDRARESAERVAAMHNEVDPAPTGPACATRRAA